MTGKKRLHAEVYGEVQGVGFRAFVLRRAMGLALTGWVRNRFDGSVELIAEGSRAALESLLADISRGPSAATVERVEESWEEPTSEFRMFGLR
ncbi:MAG TPA: acylphosphatase [Anaerolineales bacterium]